MKGVVQRQLSVDMTWGPKGVEQIYHFVPRDYGYGPGDLFNPQALPIRGTP